MVSIPRIASRSLTGSIALTSITLRVCALGHAGRAGWRAADSPTLDPSTADPARSVSRGAQKPEARATTTLESTVSGLTGGLLLTALVVQTQTCRAATQRAGSFWATSPKGSRATAQGKCSDLASRVDPAARPQQQNLTRKGRTGQGKEPISFGGLLYQGCRRGLHQQSIV